MKNSFKLFAIIFLISGIFACVKEDDKDPEPEEKVNFYANLKGSSEVPSNTSGASGSATAVFNKTTKVLTLTVHYSGLTVTDAHIHKGGCSRRGCFSSDSRSFPYYFHKRSPHFFAGSRPNGPPVIYQPSQHRLSGW
jgi:hypothetical protein